MKKRKKFFFLLWNCIIIFVAVESFLGFYLPTPLFYRINISNCGTYTLTPNKKLVYVPKPNTPEFNADGYRGRLYPFAKSEDKTRVVFIGDSVVDGIGVPLDKRFTNLLNAKINSNCEFINLAVSGYNLEQELEYFKEKGLKYSPDYVFFGITHNDLERSSGQMVNFRENLDAMKEGIYYYYYYKVSDRVENVLLKSNTYKLLKYILIYRNHKEKKYTQYNDGKIIYDISNTKAKKIIKEIKEASVHYNFKLYFIFLPSRNDISNSNIIKDIALKLDIPVIDINQFLEENYGNEYKNSLLIPNDSCHLDVIGHEFVAGFLCNQFKNL